MSIARFLASRCNSMHVLPQNQKVALVIVVVAFVKDLWQRVLSWLHLNLSIATLFVPTGGPPIIDPTEPRSDWNSSLIGTHPRSAPDRSLSGAAEVHGITCACVPSSRLRVLPRLATTRVAGWREVNHIDSYQPDVKVFPSIYINQHLQRHRVL